MRPAPTSRGSGGQSRNCFNSPILVFVQIDIWLNEGGARQTKRGPGRCHAVSKESHHDIS